MDDVLTIDGRMGEGGGSILRLGVGFAVLFNRPIKIINIRANRSKPGLRLQHTMGLIALQKLTEGELLNAFVGSKEITFKPGNKLHRKLDIEIKTAGSIALFCQTLQNALIYADKPGKVTVNIHGGGTFGKGAPDPYYVNNVTYYYFGKMGYNCGISVKRNGFYPKGGAEAVFTAEPLPRGSKIRIPDFEYSEENGPGSPVGIEGTIVVSSNLKRPRVAERIKNAVIDYLISNPMEVGSPSGNVRSYRITKDMINIRYIYENTYSPGVGVNIRTEFDSGVRLSGKTILGERGVPSEKVAEMAVRSMLVPVNAGASVDENLADQIIPLLYLCDEPYPIYTPAITSHMQTNIDLLNLFAERKYSIEEIGGCYKFTYKSE